MPLLATVDLEQRCDRERYHKTLVRYQLEVRRLAFELYQRQRSAVIVFEGWDASGKGGTIRRLTEKLDPRGYEVYTIAAPEGDERVHHYLWRFWRRLLPPQEKQLLVFDRSWYGRVLVERVEGFAEPEAWRRAYREINEFETQLTDAGVTLVKLWLHISKDEQLRRFEARRNTPHKRWKLTGEDWRNREQWDRYHEAAEEMLVKTSTVTAPWSVVAANDKLFARVETLRVVACALDAGSGGRGTEAGRRGKRKQKKGG